MIPFLLLTGCSTRVDIADPGIALWCHDDPCPTESHVACVAEHFQFLFPDFRARDPLRVDWQRPPIDECMDDTAVACSPDAASVVVSSDSLLTHELHHIERWRAFGDPDYDHASPDWGTEEHLASLAPNGCE